MAANPVHIMMLKESKAGSEIMINDNKVIIMPTRKIQFQSVKPYARISRAFFMAVKPLKSSHAPAITGKNAILISGVVAR